MRNRRLFAAGLLASGACLAWAGSAAAVTPVLSCVAPRTGGLTAYYGYSNPTPAARVIGVGTGNRFTPSPADRGQPVLFSPDNAAQPGFADTRAQIAAAVDFAGTVTWNLDGGSAAASAASARCNFDLTIAMGVDKPDVRPGEDVTWTVTVRNSGSSPLPRNQIVFTTQDLPPLSIAGNPPDELLPGEALSYRGITRPSSGSCGTSATGLGEVSMGPGIVDTREGDLTNNRAQTGFTVRCVSDLTIASSTDATTYSPGQTARYTITVTNSGDVPVPTASIAVTDPALTGITPSAALPAMLEPRATVQYLASRAITADLCATGATSTSAVGFSTSSLTDANPADNTVTRPLTVAGGACSAISVPTPPPASNPPGADVQSQTTLSLSTAGRGRVAAGGLGTYLITVRNTGATAARGVVVSGFTPSGAALAGTPNGASIANGRAVWRLGDLEPGGTRTVRVGMRFLRRVTRTSITSAIAAAQNAPSVRSAFPVRVVARPVRVQQVPETTPTPTTPTPRRRTPVTG